MEAVVYWLHLPTHNDICSEGYVGVSTRPEQRLDEHFKTIENGTHENAYLLDAIKRSGNTIIQEIVARGTEEYCYKIEEKLRPGREIGWNISEGGSRPPIQKDKIWINDGKNHKRIKAVDRHNFQGWVDGRINVFSDEEKERRRQMYSGANNPFYGKRHSKEANEQNRDWHLGRIPANAKEVIFRDVEYPSLANASQETGLSIYYIKKELKWN